MKVLFFALCATAGIALSSQAQEKMPLTTGTPSQYQTVRETLEIYGKLIGKKVLMDPNVNGQMDLCFTHEMDDAKKAKMIERQMYLDGYALLDADQDVVEVLGVGKQTRSAAIPLYTKPEEFPEHERTFSYVYKTRYRNPLELSNAVSQYILPSSYNGFTPDVKSNTLILTESTTLMKRIVRLLALLDVPPDNGDSPAPVSRQDPARTPE